MDWLLQHPELGWLALALVLFGIEMFGGTDLWLLMLGVGVLGGAGVLALGLGAPLALLVAAAISVLLLALVRPSVLKRLHAGPDLRIEPTADLIGRHTSASTEITAGAGQIKVDGVVWTARPYMEEMRIPVGTPVEIFEVDGVTAVVHPLQDPDDELLVQEHQPLTSPPADDPATVEKPATET